MTTTDIVMMLFGLLVSISGFLLIRMINKMDTCISLLESTTKQADDFLEDQINKNKEKTEQEFKELRKEFWAEIEKIKETHMNSFKELTQSIHTVNDNVIAEIRKLEVAILNTKNKSRE